MTNLSGPDGGSFGTGHGAERVPEYAADQRSVRM
jgi:hypothetical protein